MRNWSFWDWLAYACLLVGAVILAADTGLKIAPDLAQSLPLWASNPLWGFAPLVLLVVATVIFIVREFGWLDGPFSRKALNFFLERDSGSDRRGIQSFPTVTFIQISVTANMLVEQCRVWTRKVEYSAGIGIPFALEHNERHPITWSKAAGADAFAITIHPKEPPIRINNLTYTTDGLQYEPQAQTPANLFVPLQRLGIHRFEIQISGIAKGRRHFSIVKYLYVDWRGPQSGAFVDLKDN